MIIHNYIGWFYRNLEEFPRHLWVWRSIQPEHMSISHYWDGGQEGMSLSRTEENKNVKSCHIQIRCQDPSGHHSKQAPTWCLYSCHFPALSKIIILFHVLYFSFPWTLYITVCIQKHIYIYTHRHNSCTYYIYWNVLHIIWKYIINQFHCLLHLYKSKVTMSVSAILLLLFEVPLLFNVI